LHFKPKYLQKRNSHASFYVFGSWHDKTYKNNGEFIMNKLKTMVAASALLFGTAAANPDEAKFTVNVPDFFDMVCIDATPITISDLASNNLLLTDYENKASYKIHVECTLTSNSESWDIEVSGDGKLKNGNDETIKANTTEGPNDNLVFYAEVGSIADGFFQIGEGNDALLSDVINNNGAFTQDGAVVIKIGAGLEGASLVMPKAGAYTSEITVNAVASSP
jgi:hypothetical protein